MTKCDFCVYSVIKNGQLNCKFDHCRESQGRVNIMADMAAKANIKIAQAKTRREINRE